MRTSSYTIYVDLPDQTGDVVLVHGYTNAYFKVSKSVASYIRSLELRRAPKPLFGDWPVDPPSDQSAAVPSEQTLSSLRRRGFLTELSFEAEELFFCNIVNKMHEKSMRGMPTYMFMPTYDCNLRCGYCYQGHLRTNPLYNHVLKTMPLTMVDRIFAGLPQIEEGHGVEVTPNSERDIGFFGGEPFLTESRPVVEHIIEKTLRIGRGTFWAISNATELEAYRSLLSPELISKIQVTLDGPPEEHDKRRIYADGSGSFAKIAANITMALECGTRIAVRMNVDRNNVDQTPQLAEAIQAQGWDKYPHFSAYVAPIRKFGAAVDIGSVMNSWELDEAVAKTSTDFPLVKIIGRPSDDVQARASSLFSGDTSRLRNLRESGCSAHSTLYMFDAFGSIYFCWEHVGEYAGRAGYVKEDGSIELNQDIATTWRSRTVASNKVCRQCRYALSCGGGCAASAMAQSGKMNSNFCDGFATRFRAATARGYIASQQEQSDVVAASS